MVHRLKPYVRYFDRECVHSLKCVVSGLHSPSLYLVHADAPTQHCFALVDQRLIAADFPLYILLSMHVVICTAYIFHPPAFTMSRAPHFDWHSREPLQCGSWRVRPFDDLFFFAVQQLHLGSFRLFPSNWPHKFELDLLMVFPVQEYLHNGSVGSTHRSGQFEMIMVL